MNEYCILATRPSTKTIQVIVQAENEDDAVALAHEKALAYDWSKEAEWEEEYEYEIEEVINVNP